MDYYQPPEPEGLRGDAYYMALALQQAARGLGRTAPNPVVGCIIVQPGNSPLAPVAQPASQGTVVGQGFHPQAGAPHAEVFALRQAGASARGATAYVTLEPCSHTGRTPPCADALIAAGVARVVIAARDPNPRVDGGGIRRLRAAGIDVLLGVLAEHAVYQQAGFRSVVQRARPWLIYKYAMTLDGKIAAEAEGNGTVSGVAARQQVMQWRKQVDAVAVGIGTVLADDPRLTVRSPHGEEAAHQPRALVFDRQLRTPVHAKVVRDGTCIVCHPAAVATAAAEQLQTRGATLFPALSLSDALQQLAQHSIHSILLEGGAHLASAFVAQDAIDEVRAMVAPTLLGAGLSPLVAPRRSMSQARRLHAVHSQLCGEDVLIRGLTAPLASLLPYHSRADGEHTTPAIKTGDSYVHRHY